MIEIRFLDNKPSLKFDVKTVDEAVRTAASNGDDLTHAKLRNTDLRWLYLKGVDLSYADLFGADLREADLRDAKLCHANLRGANLKGARLWDADLYGAILCDSELEGVSFMRANLRYADLKYTNLRGANLIDAHLYGADLDYSCLPLWCGSLKAKIDKRIFCQILYHTLRAGQSVDDPEVQALFAIPEVVALADKFHRVKECGRILNQKVENPNQEVRR